MSDIRDKLLDLRQVQQRHWRAVHKQPCQMQGRQGQEACTALPSLQKLFNQAMQGSISMQGSPSTQPYSLDKDTCTGGVNSRKVQGAY